MIQHEIALHICQKQTNDFILFHAVLNTEVIIFLILES